MTNGFLQGGYGQGGVGEGIIAHSVFNSSWSSSPSKLDTVQKSWFRVPMEDFTEDKIMTMCLKACQRLGIIDPDTLIPLKFLTHALVSLLPLTCAGSTGHDLMKLIAKYYPMGDHYGRKFAYGSNRELVKAKFSGDGNDVGASPLQVASFLQEIEEVEDLEQAGVIWDKLVAGEYILVDNGIPEDKLAAIGKEGKSTLFRYTDLQRDLAGVDQEATTFTEPIMRLLYERLLSDSMARPQGAVTLTEFQDVYVEWWGYLDMDTPIIIINRAKEAASKIYTALQAKGYWTASLTSLLHADFVAVLKGHENLIGPITKVMLTHFKSQIGRNVFDYESYRIDPNGNHGMFYAGFHRHTLEYTPNTNQVATLRIQDPYALPGQDETVYEMQHDSQGNVNRLPHRGVTKIKYHPVINRPTFMELADGRRITIKYDGQGERLLKRVFSKEIKLVSEVKYLRDENGAVMMDKRSTFDAAGKLVEEISTTYLYGPRYTLLGFVRNGKLYTVFTDHAGSVRLIMQNGRVVAGYDYWPYGDLIRAYGEDDAHIMYRFTGQEFDPETGLYNYHARMYDPTLGRFLQADPKSQYFSPYVYGGNSPISLVDPDGEFFFLIPILFAVVFAYFAVAATQGFNPARWKWKEGKTWLALIGGAVAGFMLPGAIAAASLPALLVGFAGAYWKAAREQGSWNSRDWDWKSPALYNSFLNGFADGLSLAGSISGVKGKLKDVKKFGKTLSKTGQKVFYAGTALAGVAGALLEGASANGNNFKFWQWDWKSMETYGAIIGGFGSGIDAARGGTSRAKNFMQANKENTWKETLKNLRTSSTTKLKAYLKDKMHPNFETLGRAILTFGTIALGQEDFNPAKWKWSEMGTYEGIINSWKESKEIIELGEMYNDKNKKSWERFKEKVGIKDQHLTLRDYSMGMIRALGKMSNFYFPLPLPSSRKGRDPYQDMLPVILRLFGSLISEAASEMDIGLGTIFPQDVNTEFEQQMVKMIEGLDAGATIIPTAVSGLENFVDCAFHDSSNGTDAQAFKSCFIGDATSQKSRENQEFNRKLFMPTSLFQNKNDFVVVEPTNSDDDRQSEYVEDLASYFLADFRLASTLLTPDVVTGMFTGAIASSLANQSEKRAPSLDKIFFGSYDVSSIGTNMLHLVKVTEEEPSTYVMSVRSIVTMSLEEFNKSKNTLRDTVLDLKYNCFLPDDMVEQVKVIQGETVVVTTSPNYGSSQVLVITPDYVPTSLTSCKGNGSPQKLKQLSVPNADLYEAFKQLQKRNLSEAENMQKYYEFVEAAMKFFSEADSMTSFPGFMYGLVAFNFRRTYDLSLQLNNDAVLVVPRRKEGGQDTLQAVPFVLAQSDNSTITGISQFLNQAALLTLSKKTLQGTVSADTGKISVSLQALPKYEGVFDLIFTHDVTEMKQLVQYLYYNYHQTRSSRTPPETSTNDHFISNMILGEFLSRQMTGQDNLEFYVFAPSNTGEQQRLASQRLFFVRNPDNSKCAILNFIESSKISSDGKIEFDSTTMRDIPSIPDVNVEYLEMYEIQLNINSLSGWSLEEAIDKDATKAQIFLQDVYESPLDYRNIKRDRDAYLKLESLPAQLSQGHPKFDFSEDYITSMFQLLSDNRLQVLVNTESDFQSVVTGLFMGASALAEKDTDGVGVALRNFVLEAGELGRKDNVDPSTLSLVSVLEEGVVIPNTEQVLVAKFKTVEGQTEVKKKMEDAIQELSEFYCLRETKLKEVFKVINMPAVYDTGTSNPPTGDRVRVEVDPEPLTNMNCTEARNPFREWLKTNEGSNAGPTEDFTTKYDHPKAPFQDDSLDGCHLGAWVSDHYSVDGITCSTGRSKVQVFRHIEEHDIVLGSSRGKPFSLVGDSYRREACTPLEFNGRLAVACEGEKTTLIYTPYLEPRPFEELDGRLMLGRVALHWGGKLWNFVREGGWRKTEPEVSIHIVDQAMMSGWETDLEGVRAAVGKWVGDEREITWAKQQMQECQEIIDQVKDGEGNATPEVIEDITERLMALQEDVAEQIVFAQVGQDFFKKEMSDNLDDEERVASEVNYSQFAAGQQRQSGANGMGNFGGEGHGNVHQRF